MSEKTDIQAWLEENTGWCEHFQARITPEQCRENKRKAQKLGDLEPIYKCCLNCPGIQKVGQTSQEDKEKNIRRESNQLVFCQKCGKKTKNYGRGLCAKCYKEAKLNGTLKAYKLKDAVTIEKKSEAIEKTQKTESSPKKSSPKRSKRDLLVGAERIMFRTQKNIRSTRARKSANFPKVRLHANLQRLEFNSYVIDEFKLDRYKYVSFYRKDNNIYMLLQTYSNDTNTLQIVWKDNRRKSTIVISCARIARKIGWTGGECFDARATSRKDVIKLEKKED